MDKAHILVVDDESTNRLLLSEMLDEYTVSTANNGETMWNELKSKAIDLILLDVMMPDEDGFSLGKQIKANKLYKHIPIIFVTAKVTGEDIQEGFKSGAFDYIKKPYNSLELENRVKKALKETQETQDLRSKSITAEMVFDQILDSLIITDREFRIEKSNPACTNLIGFSKDELFDCLLPDMLYDKDGYSLSITNLIQKTTDIWILTKNQELIPVRFTLSSIIDKDGLETGWSCMFQDISKQVEIEQALIKAKEESEEASKLKSSFLASMSHEIRTPLNAILGFSDLLEDQDASEDDKLHYIDVIKKNGNKLLSFIENLLDISVIESQRINIKKSPCNIRELCNELYKDFLIIKDTYPNSNVELIRISNLPEDFEFETDRDRLQQILHNLLENACKFTEKGEIRFTYNSNVQTNTLEFIIQDSGIGIPEENIETIFSNFQKIQNSKIHYSTGIGLGLSITKNLVQLLGGEIFAESTIDKGSTFKVLFPLS